MKNLSVSLFILFFLLIGCKDENNIVEPPGDSIEIVPLEVGNSWIFQITTYDSSANIISNNIDTARVVSDTLINGKRYFFFPFNNLRWNNEIGYWLPIANSNGNPDSTLLYKYPANVGDQYGNLIRVICKDSSIVTPHGTFKCYGYAGSVATDFVSPGIGLVKEEWYKSNSIGIKYIYQKQELIDYHLN